MRQMVMVTMATVVSKSVFLFHQEEYIFRYFPLFYTIHKYYYKLNLCHFGVSLDISNMLYGHVMVPLYDTLGPDTVEYVIKHSCL